MFVALSNLTFWILGLYERAEEGVLTRFEEEMLSLRSYLALATAAARPFDRPSDWRRSCVGMTFEHQISKQGQGLDLA